MRLDGFIKSCMLGSFTEKNNGPGEDLPNCVSTFNNWNDIDAVTGVRILYMLSLLRKKDLT